MNATGVYGTRVAQRRLPSPCEVSAIELNLLALLVHGAVVARAYVTNPPQDSVIMMGEYGSVKEAERLARFEVPMQRGR